MQRVVMFGSGAVGKSSLTIQFVRGRFVVDYDPTIEDSYKRSIHIDNQIRVMDILDTAGQDEFKFMRNGYIRSASGFIIVFSLTDRGTFEEVEEFYKNIQMAKCGEKFFCLICGNKRDLDSLRTVSSYEGKELATSLGCNYIETSAKDSIDVEELFITAARGLLSLHEPPVESTVSSGKLKKHHKKCHLL